MGNHKKSALWARDVNDLDPTPENAKRMNGLWQKNIDKAIESGSTRDIGKSYWQLFKRTKKIDVEKADEYRLKAIDWYKKLLKESKEKSKEKHIRESYWALSELIG